MAKLTRAQRKTNDLTRLPSGTGNIIANNHRASNDDDYDSAVQFDEVHSKIPALYATLSDIADFTSLAVVQAALDTVGAAAPTLVEGDRVLVKDQTTGSENGIYQVSGTEMIRASDANTTGELRGGSTVRIVKGDTYQNSTFGQSSPEKIADIGVDAIVFDEIGGAGGVTDHGALTGLADDDHLQYVKGVGRVGGQTIIGGTVASENLTFESTSNATKGQIIFKDQALHEGFGASTGLIFKDGGQIYQPFDAVGSLRISGDSIDLYNKAGTVAYATFGDSGFIRSLGVNQITWAGGDVDIPNGALTVSEDIDATTILGKTRIDSRIGDFMFISHYDMTAGTQFALRQASSGATRVNGVAFLDLQVNGSTVVQLSPTLFNTTDGINWQFGTTTGTKIGINATQKLAFWGATPIVQPAHIADPVGGATIDAEARTAINAINAMLAATGLTAAV
jgi:hypothetical protein